MHWEIVQRERLEKCWLDWDCGFFPRGPLSLKCRQRRLGGEHIRSSDIAGSSCSHFLVSFLAFVLLDGDHCLQNQPGSVRYSQQSLPVQQLADAAASFAAV